MKKIAIFASGSGSNAIKIISHLQAHNVAQIAYIICNNPRAGIRSKAPQYDVPVIDIDKSFKDNPQPIIQKLTDDSIDLIVLAGFLWKVPEVLVTAFPKRIINIHPALLPKYGGKGMYGQHIHKAVMENKETQSGLTIHYVNEEYDEGEYILQVYCPIHPIDTPESLAAKVLKLEHTYYPIAIASLLES